MHSEQGSPKPRGAWVFELLLIALWALWVGRAFLNFDATLWPSGREVGMVIRTHYIWTLLPRCGTCMLWNGFVNGGAPAFAELHGAVLYPLVPLFTLLWGVINGTKLLLLASLVLAGWAQWWLARVMGLGRLARLWTAAMAVVGGHLAGRLEHGVVGLVLATAACSLVIPPALDWVKTGRRRSALLLGLTLALALLAGQAYMQLTLLVGVFPAFALYVFDPHCPRRRLGKGFIFTLGLALLLSGVFWAPLLHFLPNFSKDVDPDFVAIQPLEYLPLNLVIRSVDFYTTSTLGRLPYPYLYTNYIGWIPVLLALAALILAPRAERRQLYWLLLAIALVYLCASATLLRPLETLFPAFVQSFRYLSVGSGLAVPLLLALAGWGLTLLLQHLQARFPFWLMFWRRSRPLNGWALVTLPVLLYALGLAYTFGQNWLQTLKVPPEVSQVLDQLRTESAEWVTPPFGEHFWTPPALESGLKLTYVVSPWRWKGRSYPDPYLKAERQSGFFYAPDTSAALEGITIVEDPAQAYASVLTPAGVAACQATALGGQIDVTCNTEAAGVLTVKEHQWDGWYAWLNGKPVALDRDSEWLSVSAPPGQNCFQFRYRPWDVWLGLLGTCVGGGLTAYLWRRPVRDSALLLRLDAWTDGVWVFVRRQRACLGTALRGVSLYDERRLLRVALGVNGMALLAFGVLFILSLQRGSSKSDFVLQFMRAAFVLSALVGGVEFWSARARQRRRP